MAVRHHELTLDSEGHGHVADISVSAASWLGSIGAADGLLNVFIPGSTAVVTTIEFEPGAVKDLDEALEASRPRAAFFGRFRSARVLHTARNGELGVPVAIV